MDRNSGRSHKGLTFDTLDEIRINIMRISNCFDVEFVDKTTLHQYSLMQYSFAMQQADIKNQNSYLALFNRVAQGLEGKVKMTDIYDYESELLQIFGKTSEDAMSEEEKANVQAMLALNNSLNKKN